MPTERLTDTHDVDPEDFSEPYDTPPTAELLGADEAEPEVPAVPVRLTNRVRVDQLPTRLGITKSINVSSTEPEELVPENPRRATLHMWLAAGTTVRVGRTRDEVLRDDSSIILTGNAGPWRFHWTDSVWAIKTAAGAGTDRFCIATEDYAR